MISFYSNAIYSVQQLRNVQQITNGIMAHSQQSSVRYPLNHSQTSALVDYMVRGQCGYNKALYDASDTVFFFYLKTYSLLS